MCKLGILVYFIYLMNNGVFGFSKLIVNNMLVNESKDEVSRRPNEIYFVPKNSTSNSHSVLITKLNFTKASEIVPHDLFVIGEDPNYFKYHITSNSGEVKPKIPPKNKNEEDYKKKLEYLNKLLNCSVLSNTLKDLKDTTKSKTVTTAVPIFKKPKDWKKTSKKPIKIVYESPAPVKFVENTLNSVYSFFEDTFTTKVKVPTQKLKLKKKSKKKLRTKKINRRQGLSSSTYAKKVQTTPSIKLIKKITPKNIKQIMTTQIHVTSEYGGPTTPAFVEQPNTPIMIKNKDKSESSEDDDYDFDFSFGNEDDSSESSSEEKRPSSYDNDVDPEYDEDEDDEDDDEDDSDDENSDTESFFGRIFNSISKLFGENRKKKSSNYHYEEGRSTTPRIDYRKPKYPIYSESTDNPLQKTWYNPYIPSSFYELSAEDEVDEINEVSTTVPTTQSGWFNNWFQEEDTNKINEITTTTSKTTKEPGWFDGFFGNPFDDEDETLTTTTVKPLINAADSYANLTEWIMFLKQKLKPLKVTTSGNSDSLPKRKFYNKYQMWRIYPTTKEHVNLLEDFRFSSEENEIQWWKGPTLRGPTDIAIPPEKINAVKEMLDYEEIAYETIIWDLQKALLYENPKMSKREKMEVELLQGHPLTWYRYHRYDDIMKFMEYLHRKYPKYVELIHIGQSYEGRHLIIAKISFDDEAEEYSKKQPLFMYKKKQFRKSGVFIEAGAHAREWIGPAVATFIMDTLIKGIAKNDTEGETIRSVDWYIIPTINPDGYEYSHLFDRMWKKSRSAISNQKSKGILSSALNWMNSQPPIQRNCYGVDLNRNFDSAWEVKGDSESPCSDIFMGPKPASTPEARLLSKFLMENKKYLKLFISLHSYGQMITYPTSANLSYHSQKVDDLLDMALVASESLRGVGSSSRYLIDSSNEMLFSRSGSSDFFAFNKADIPYSYTIELRDTGTHGFILPPSYIEATAKDAFTIIKAMADYL